MSDQLLRPPGLAWEQRKIDTSEDVTLRDERNAQSGDPDRKEMDFNAHKVKANGMS